MCGPTISTTAAQKSFPIIAADKASTSTTATTINGQSTTSKAQPKSDSPYQRGFMYGTISLALTVLAATVTMGHYTSLRDELGCDALCVGSMTSASSTLRLVGSTLIGRWSDSTSSLYNARKACMLLGLASLLVNLVLSSTATSISGLWIASIPSALLQQNYNVLKALFGEYHGDSVSAAERAGSVGQLGMVVGLAFMAGPFLSATLLETYQQAAWFGGFCVIGAGLCIAAMPPAPRRPTKETPPTSLLSSPWWRRLLPDLVPAARTPPALLLAALRLFMGLAFHIFQTIWTVVLKERFDFGPADYSRYFGLIGLTFAISQGFVAKRVLQACGQTPRGRARLLMVCAAWLGGGRFLVYHSHNLTLVSILFVIIVLALGIVNTIVTADTSRIADPQDLGGLFGVLASVESVAGIAGPVLGGGLASTIHPVWGPMGAVVGLYALVFGLVAWGYEGVMTRDDSQSKETASKKED